jgi:predicted RNase H-related nuclease YkuK (DUF458 family)
MHNKEINFEEVKEYLSKCGPETKIYIGADSERINIDNTWHVDVMAVLIIHVDAKHGGKFFGQIRRERDYDKALNKPRMRMMMEAYAAADLYLRFVELIDQYEVQVHLDINQNPLHGSNCAYAEAVGYIKGVCGVEPITKPKDPTSRDRPWAASIVADSTKRLLAA